MTRAINEKPQPNVGPTFPETSISCKEKFEQRDDEDKGDPGTLSMCELLELAPNEVDDLVKDLFGSEIPIPPSTVAVKNSNQLNTYKPCSKQEIAPKMMFQNSNITINFNINKA